METIPTPVAGLQAARVQPKQALDGGASTAAPLLCERPATHAQQFPAWLQAALCQQDRPRGTTQEERAWRATAWCQKRQSAWHCVCTWLCWKRAKQRQRAWRSRRCPAPSIRARTGEAQAVGARRSSATARWCRGQECSSCNRQCWCNAAE